MASTAKAAGTIRASSAGHRRPGLRERPTTPFEVLGHVRAVTALVAAFDDGRPLRFGVRKVRIEIVDVDPRRIGEYSPLALELEDQDRNVAVVELDPRSLPGLEDACPRAKLEDALKPPCRLDGALVEERDAERRDLLRPTFAEPRAEPGERPRPEVEHLLAARNERLRDSHERAALDRLKSDVHLAVVDAAAVREPVAGLPGRDPAQLERVVFVDLEDSPVDSRLDPHADGASSVEEVDRPAYPPGVDLVGEGGEGPARIDGHLDFRACRSFGHELGR